MYILTSPDFRPPARVSGAIEPSAAGPCALPSIPSPRPDSALRTGCEKLSYPSMDDSILGLLSPTIACSTRIGTFIRLRLISGLGRNMCRIQTILDRAPARRMRHSRLRNPTRSGMSGSIYNCAAPRWKRKCRWFVLKIVPASAGCPSVNSNCSSTTSGTCSITPASWLNGSETKLVSAWVGLDHSDFAYGQSYDTNACATRVANWSKVKIS